MKIFRRLKRADSAADLKAAVALLHYAQAVNAADQSDLEKALAELTGDRAFAKLMAGIAEGEKYFALGHDAFARAKTRLDYLKTKTGEQHHA